MVSDPLRLNGALDGLVLGGLQVFGVPSPPLYVLANGEQVRDFMYRSDTKVNDLWLLPIDSLCLLPNVFLQIKLCFLFYFPQVLTVTNLALPMSTVFTVQWALWCTELYYPRTIGSLGIFPCCWKISCISLHCPNHPRPGDAPYAMLPLYPRTAL